MKKTKLKFAAAVAALAMTFALFTGCNPGEDATSSDTTGGTETTTQTPTESGDGEEEEKEPEKVGSTEEALPTTLEFNKAYTGYIEYTYETSDSTYKTVSPSEVMLSVPKTGLVADGTVKLTYKISGISSVATSVTNQGVFDKWAWADTVSTVADGTSVTKRWTITQAGLDSIEGDSAQFKIVPQYSGDDYASKVNTSFKLTVSDLTLSYIEPVAAGSETTETIAENVGNWNQIITVEDLKTKYATATEGTMKMILNCTYGNYTPEYNYDGMGALQDNIKTICGISNGCEKDAYSAKIGTTFTVEFDVDTILNALTENSSIIILEVWNEKFTCESIELVYVKK